MRGHIDGVLSQKVSSVCRFGGFQRSN